MRVCCTGLSSQANTTKPSTQKCQGLTPENSSGGAVTHDTPSGGAVTQDTGSSSQGTVPRKALVLVMPVEAVGTPRADWEVKVVDAADGVEGGSAGVEGDPSVEAGDVVELVELRFVMLVELTEAVESVVAVLLVADSVMMVLLVLERVTTVVTGGRPCDNSGAATGPTGAAAGPATAGARYYASSAAGAGSTGTGGAPRAGGARGRMEQLKAGSGGQSPSLRPHAGEPIIHRLAGATNQIKGLRGVDHRQGTGQDDAGPGVRLWQGQLGQDVVPLLLAELRRARQDQRRRERQHLDAMDVLEPPAEPGGVVHLVLKEDAGDMVLHKVRRVVHILRGHQEELLYLGQEKPPA